MITVGRLSECLAISFLAITPAWPQTISTRLSLQFRPGEPPTLPPACWRSRSGAERMVFAIENRTGAGGIIGAEAALPSPQSDTFSTSAHPVVRSLQGALPE
jgi:hypothetical protein